MRNAAIIATILLTSLALAPFAHGSIVIDPSGVADTAIVAAAANLYGSGGSVHAASNAYFAAAFPSHQLYVVRMPTGLPPETHAMAWNPVLQHAFDATKQYNALLTDSGAIVSTASDALKYSKAYAEVANVELGVIRDVVTSANSTELGVTVADPAATPLLNGWQATLTTWSRENGVLADWVIRFNAAAVDSAKWKVTQTGVGEHRATWAATAFRPNIWIWNLYSPTAGHELRAYQEESDGTLTLLKTGAAATGQDFSTYTSATNFDGTTWTVYYPTQGIADIPESAADLAIAARDGGVYAYQTHVTKSTAPCAGTMNPQTNWGFNSADPDCNLQVYVLEPRSLYCIACIVPGDDVRIYLSPAMVETLQAFGWFTNPEKHTTTTITRVVMGHEHFHNLQYVIMQWQPRCDAVMEGQARFQETLTDPDASQDPSSPWYFDSNYYQEKTNHALADQSYSAALYWGWFYANKGGIGAIKLVLEKMTSVTDGRCEFAISYAINMALGGQNGQTSLAGQTYIDHAINDFPETRQFSWSTPLGGSTNNWATYLYGPWEPSYQNGVVTGGFAMKRVPTDGTYDIECAWSVGDAVRFVTRSGSTVNTETWDCTNFQKFRRTTSGLTEAAVIFIRTVSDEEMWYFHYKHIRV